MSFEKHLGLCERFEKYQENLTQINQLTEIIDEVNIHTTNSKEIVDATRQIRKITKDIIE